MDFGCSIQYSTILNENGHVLYVATVRDDNGREVNGAFYSQPEPARLSAIAEYRELLKAEDKSIKPKDVKDALDWLRNFDTYGSYQTRLNIVEEYIESLEKFIDGFKINDKED
jgi:hypothetical protein